MPGLYCNIWTCTKCNYNEQTISGPFRIEPKPGVIRASIEDRWCNQCQGIRKCFTGTGYIFKPGDEPNSKVDRWEYMENKGVDATIEDLQIKKMSMHLSSKENEELNILLESKAICQKLTQNARLFYEQLQPKPRCLICGSNNISSIDWSHDNHSCGGEFRRSDSGRIGSVSSYDFIQYDEYGKSNHSIKSM